MKKTTNVKTESVASKPDYKWGVFDHRALDGTVHSVPVIDGVPVSPHILGPDCPCNPVLEQYDYTFYNHKEMK